jgi:pyrophosphatase PpaX
MNKINTVLFDFDGTLMNTNELIIGSWQHTYKTITGKHGDREAIIRTFGETLKVSMMKAFPDYPTHEAIEIYRSYQTGRFGDFISLFPGMLELLKELKDKVYKTAIVTSRLRPTTTEGVEKFGLDKLLDEIITMEDCTKHKPDPEPVLIALEKLGAKPEESILLGDSMFDIKCAKAAGVKSVLVGWAMAVTEEDKQGPDAPDYIIETAEELLDILDGR